MEVKMQSSAKIWGIQPNELLLNFSCDGYLENFHDTYYRGVTIHAKAEIIFRWICQMKVAPYSGIFGKLIRRILPVGDLIMMRRQLLNFKKLSEHTKKT